MNPTWNNSIKNLKSGCRKIEDTELKPSDQRSVQKNKQFQYPFIPTNKKKKNILTYQYRGSILPTGTCIALYDILEIATAGKIGQVFLPDSNMLLEDIKILHWPLK